MLALLLARTTARRRIAERGDCVLMLLMCGAWAGLGAADNLLQLLVFLNLFIFVTYRWLSSKGIRWAFFYVPDHSDDDRK